MATERLSYLPALDGLRAVAVTFVVAYHLEFGWARGGFLGVDLFFVISGFLITTLLIQEHDNAGRISLGSFWTRRFRRLVPPLVIMTAATVAATRLFGLPEQWASIRWDAAAAVGYIANWRFVFADQSYFETLLGPSPLRHTWSLAVEEQWYVLWPAVVVGLLLLATRSAWSRWAPIGLIAAGAVGSAILMAALYDPADPTRVYFGTDTRAQQLLVGAGLAWLMSRYRLPNSAASGRLRGAMVTVAFAGFVAIAATTSDEAPWLYHGGFLAISVLCAVIVWAVSHNDGPLPWLGVGPLVWVGTRSYGIYLWHWPVIVFVGPAMGIELSRYPLAALQVVIAVALAELSFRLIERPVRISKLRPGFLIGGWTAISAITALVAVLILVPPQGRSLNAEVIRPDPTTTTSTTTPPPTRPGTATSSTVATTVAPQPTTVLLLGDSTAVSLMERRSIDFGPSWNVQASARVGCSFVVGNPIDVGATFAITQGEECGQWRAEWSDAFAQVRPDVAVVMIGAWEVLDHNVEGGVVRFPDPAWYDLVRTAVGEAISIAGTDDTPVVLLTLPCMQQSIDSDFPAQARNDAVRVSAFNDLLRDAAAVNPNVSIIELHDRLCPDGVFLAEVDGAPLRYDGVHVTPEGANYVWPWLLDELSSMPLEPAPDEAEPAAMSRSTPG